MSNTSLPPTTTSTTSQPRLSGSELPNVSSSITNVAELKRMCTVLESIVSDIKVFAEQQGSNERVASIYASYPSIGSFFERASQSGSWISWLPTEFVENADDFGTNSHLPQENSQPTAYWNTILCSLLMDTESLCSCDICEIFNGRVKQLSDMQIGNTWLVWLPDELVENMDEIGVTKSAPELATTSRQQSTMITPFKSKSLNLSGYTCYEVEFPTDDSTSTSSCSSSSSSIVTVYGYMCYSHDEADDADDEGYSSAVDDSGYFTSHSSSPKSTPSTSFESMDIDESFASAESDNDSTQDEPGLLGALCGLEYYPTVILQRIRQLTSSSVERLKTEAKACQTEDTSFEWFDESDSRTLTAGYTRSSSLMYSEFSLTLDQFDYQQCPWQCDSVHEVFTSSTMIVPTSQEVDADEGLKPKCQLSGCPCACVADWHSKSSNEPQPSTSTPVKQEKPAEPFCPFELTDRSSFRRAIAESLCECAYCRRFLGESGRLFSTMSKEYREAKKEKSLWDPATTASTSSPHCHRLYYQPGL